MTEEKPIIEFLTDFGLKIGDKIYQLNNCNWVEDIIPLIEAIQNVPEPNEKLKEAFKFYEEKKRENKC